MSDPESEEGEDDVEDIQYGDEQLRDLFLDDDDDDEEFLMFLPDIDAHANLVFRRVDKRLQRINFEDTAPQPGPRHGLDATATELDYFQLFFSEAYFQNICDYTDKNATRKRQEDPDHNKGKWDKPSKEEMKAFLALKIALNVQVVVPREDRIFMTDRNYWVFHLPGVRKLFTRDRYNVLSRYVKFVDPDQEDGGSKLGKVKDLLDHVSTKFKQHYNLGQDVSLDEGMIPFKGRLGMKVRMALKPIKYGIKVFMLTDSATGYLYKFAIYTGKVEDDDAAAAPLGKTSAVVLSLVDGLEGRGHKLFTDRYYTSPLLYHNLLMRGMYACGTVMTNRKQFPAELILSQADARRAERGSYDYMSTDKGVVAVRWKDTRPIYMLTTAHDTPLTETTVARTVREDGHYHKKDIKAVTVVTDYNASMGGCDLNDQMTRLQKGAKQYRWYRRINYKVVEWCIYNAYILFKDQHQETSGRKYDVLKFRDNLVMQLIGTYRRPIKRDHRGADPADCAIRFQTGDHFPEASESTEHRCVVCIKKHQVYEKAHPNVPAKNNPHKKSKTVFFCTKCDKYLCIKRNTTCWQDYHKKVEYWR